VNESLSLPLLPLLLDDKSELLTAAEAIGFQYKNLGTG
jgi:hypothetical protein